MSEEIILKSALTFIGLLGTLIGSGIIFLVRNYFSKIQESIKTNSDESKERSKEFSIITNKIMDRQRRLEMEFIGIGKNISELSKDISRIEGSQNIMRSGLSEVSSKVERATGRIEAAFRFIDNANQRATDVASGDR